ncbi:hypothetical protein, partial [uncultured Variovorax sp.]|uniref:hypothetical protein n=1 Tax=uncultured Variovorax sp. TaxID=114708 RepID=UPI0025E7F18B
TFIVSRRSHFSEALQSSTIFSNQPNYFGFSHLPTSSLATRNICCKPPNQSFQRSLRLCTVFSNRVNFFEDFLRHPQPASQDTSRFNNTRPSAAKPTSI